ncbi:MAG: hypothetical protein ABNH02_09090 [Pseudomonadales bacterium]
MRYLCGACTTHFRLDGMALNHESKGNQKRLVCPHCKAKILALEPFNSAWRNEVSYWVLGTVIAMYVVQLLINGIPNSHYFYSSLSQVFVALASFQCYQKFGTIFTKADKNDD